MRAWPSSSSWSSWQADFNNFPEYDTVPTIEEVPEEGEVDAEGDTNYHEDVEYQYDEEDVLQASVDHEGQEEVPHDDDALFFEAINALTVTSKRLADITKARGFYQAKDRKGDGKGKSKGKKGDSFSKGKGKGKKGGKSSVISKGNGMSGSTSSGKSGGGKGKGKPGILPNRANLEVQQKRLEEASCLGCGSPNHWLQDCPKHNNYTAQITSAGVTLDAEGGAVASSWMTSLCEQKEECFELPELICEEVSGSPSETSLMTSQKGVTSLSTTTHEQDDWHIPRNPKVLLQHVHPDTTIMIADTGCQRQVAGKLWHEGRQKAISPLQPGQCGERCSCLMQGYLVAFVLFTPRVLWWSCSGIGSECCEGECPCSVFKTFFYHPGGNPQFDHGCYAFCCFENNFQAMFVTMWSLGNSD